MFVTLSKSVTHADISAQEEAASCVIKLEYVRVCVIQVIKSTPPIADVCLNKHKGLFI